ncbi:hypothetical protein ILYODFUR_011065 [Ilyodon furcidens]|uniref:Uncharacterized protein n=1 Tax=Ilyodon furcidens TaxID=33524 RepID=A0ABV0SLH1_9TELE
MHKDPWPGIEPRTFLLQGKSASNCATVQPMKYIMRQIINNIKTEKKHVSVIVEEYWKMFYCIFMYFRLWLRHAMDMEGAELHRCSLCIMPLKAPCCSCHRMT